MNKTLYIHIGTGKTGTTAIQEFLFNNEESLRDLSIKYCTSGLVKINHHNVCANFKRGDKDQVPIYERSLHELRDEIINSNFTSYVISSEYFPGLLKSEIEYLYSFLQDISEIKIVVYLRRQDEYLESWYSQIVKALNSTTSIYQLKQKLIGEKIFDYEHLTGLWSNDCVEVIVRPYEKSQFKNGNIFNDFMSILGITDISKYQKPHKTSNPSLTREQAVLKKDLIPFCNENQIRLLSIPLEMRFSASKYFLSPKERKELLDKYELINKNVAKKYLERDYLFEDLDCTDIDWKEVDLIHSGYLSKVLSYFLLNKPDDLKVLESALVKYFLCMSDNATSELGKLEYLFIALFLRPNGPNINSKLQKLF